MTNSPVQIVLNTNNFISLWERPVGGSNKDFYEGQDREFVEHKEKLADQLSSIKDIILENEFSEITYAKLVLRPSALAKTHRPTSSLFRKEVAPVVGGGDLGELFVELKPDSIETLSQKIAKAEDETKWKEDDAGNKMSNPSKLRCEVGAIEEIVPYTSSDKRNFSITEGLKWVSNPQTGGAYIVELFESPPPRKDWDNLTPEKFRLFNSFLNSLDNIGNSLIASRVELNQKGISMIGVRLEDTSVQSDIQSPIRSSVNKRKVSIRPVLQDIKSHGELLNVLDRHPLVKKITLPPIISRSKQENATDTKETFEIGKVDANVKYPKVAIVDGGVSQILDGWLEERWGILNDNDKDENHGTFIAGLLVSGKRINGEDICNENDGCKIIDLDILPKKESFGNYYPSILDFFNELETSVRLLKERTGVRIFNFSLNIEEHVSSDGYSPFAKMLDKIAEENDVIFVISAGNIKQNDFRKEWPNDATGALKILATSRNDTIKNRQKVREI